MLHLLRVLHIVGGVFWAGSTVFIAMFLIPSLRAAGPGSSAVMREIAQVRKLPLWMMLGMLLTVVSGFVLYSRDSDGFSNKVWLASGMARVLGVGAILALLGGVVGMAINSPTGRRMAALGAEIAAAGGVASPSQQQEMQKLQAKMSVGQNLTAALLLLATAAMAVARYVA